ncbi:MAG TPA: formate dehydrogenase accessory protein FdhE [Thermoanaerobaculia bacterium]|jgi:FdhE protein|nr:formate dehydrogenase accessory protein FdhE [Thermoanaerobaculia bacterium]
MIADKWDQRIRRARELAGTYPFAAEGLRFYERLAGFQKSLYADLAAASGPAKQVRPPGSLRDEPATFVLLPRFAPFLSFIEEIAPPPLAQAAAGLSAQGKMRWEVLLDEFWRQDEALTAAEALIAWTFLQPHAEHLADHTERLEIHATPPLCPLCSGSPQVGVLRPQGDGGKRSLICSLCATEWDFRRIVCPACGEEDVDKLPVYIAEELDHVRVEACDTCRHYIKTIDLTKNGRAVPVVDELAAIPLSLWAAENRYTKLSANPLGL